MGVKQTFLMPWTLALLLSLPLLIGFSLPASSETINEKMLHVQQGEVHFGGAQGVAIADSSILNPGLIIGAIEALIIPAGILGPAYVLLQRKIKEDNYSRNPGSPEAQAYFAEKEALRQEQIRRRNASETPRGSAPPRRSFFSRNVEGGNKK